MALSSIRNRTVSLALASLIGAGLLAPTAASAGGIKLYPGLAGTKLHPGIGKKPGGFKPGYGYGYGYGAAALAGGLVLGAIAASAADDECFIERRRAVDEDGNIFVRSVRVCE